MKTTQSAVTVGGPKVLSAPLSGNRPVRVPHSQL